MKKFLNFIWVLGFNLAEIFTLILLGMLMKIDVSHMVYVMITFFIGRNVCGKPMHYKKWQKCFLWTTLIFLSLFVLVKIDLALSIVLTIFSAFILTGKANLTDLFMWKGKETKYQDIIDYIKFHPASNDLVQFEENIRKQDDLTYLIYKYRFKDNLSFSEISERLQIDTQRITEHLEKVAFAMRLYCKI